MGEVRLCTKLDIVDIYNILFSHDEIGGMYLKETIEEFEKRFTDNVITFGYFVDGTLASFLITRKLMEIPSWYVLMISSKNSKIFNFKKSGFANLFDSAVEYWEKQYVFSFILIQSVNHRNLLNGRIMKLCKNLKNYQIPGATLEVIKKGNISSSTLINKLCRNNTYTRDMIVKWVFRQDYLQEDFK